MKALTCWEHVKTRAGEAEKSRSIQQKSMHRKRDKDVSQVSEVGIPQVRRSQEPSDEDEHSQNPGVCVVGHRAAVQERRDTGGLSANNDHTCGVEGFSGPRRGRVPAKTVENRRFTRSAQSRFTKCAGRVLTSTASRRRLERCMQHSADER